MADGRKFFKIEREKLGAGKNPLIRQKTERKIVKKFFKFLAVRALETQIVTFGLGKLIKGRLQIMENRFGPLLSIGWS